jgi:hypothetical protein
LLELEYADGSIAKTSGVARRMSWTLGSTTIQCDFYVLDGLSVDVVLRSDYLFEMDVFSEYENNFLDVDNEEDLVRFFGIRPVHRPTGGMNSEQLDDSK